MKTYTKEEQIKAEIKHLIKDIKKYKKMCLSFNEQIQLLKNIEYNNKNIKIKTINKKDIEKNLQISINQSSTEYNLIIKMLKLRKYRLEWIGLLCDLSYEYQIINNNK